MANPSELPGEGLLSDLAQPVRGDSHLTLHYRVSLAATGEDVISTFGGPPATLTMGVGQLAESLEQCLLGLREGDSASFDLSADQAFGEHNVELVHRIARSTLNNYGAFGASYVPGEVLEFSAPGGGRYAGVVCDVDESGAVIDFNHPLAGQAITFEVTVLGVL